MAWGKRFENLPEEERGEISKKLTEAIINFLGIFMPALIAKRVVSAILIIAGMHSIEITKLTGLCERTLRDLKHKIVDGDFDNIFGSKPGRGRKSKLHDVESQIVEEIENGNYHTHRQIADMVQEKFGITVSTSAIKRLLKKTASAN